MGNIPIYADSENDIFFVTFANFQHAWRNRVYVGENLIII